ncbi:MAG TPA: ABC transporter permease [Cyclobacteriaceae bacterium]
MFRSHLITFFRQISRNVSFSIIGISGLVIGLMTSIIFFLWAAYELSYDHYHPENDCVFWVMPNTLKDGEVETGQDTPIQLADLLRSEIPEIKSVTRMDRTRSLLKNDTKEVHKTGYYADEDFFRVFNGSVIKGSINNPLPDHHSIAISEETAQQLFENGDALGKTITLDLKYDFKVTAIYASFPENSSLDDDVSYILPFLSRTRDYTNDWEPTIIKLNSASSQAIVQDKVSHTLKQLFPNENITAYLFCLTDWRLHWQFENGKSVGGRIVYVILFCIIAVFILIMSCINYMNLATAQAARRAREIGVRKMTGATRSELIRQFLFESLVITFSAALLALLLVYVLLPFFNELTRVKLEISFNHSIVWVGLLGITVVTGLIAGGYPALILSSMKPITILKGNFSSGLKGSAFRKALVVFQFALSIVMIFSAVVMWQQMDYLLKKDLGFDQHNILYIEPKSDAHFPLESFKSEILKNPVIVSAGIGAASPMEINGAAEVTWHGKGKRNALFFNGASCDNDYLTTLGFQIVEGRNFSSNYAADSANFIITQKAADLLGFSDPIGQVINYNMYHQQNGKIIGIVKDFNNDDIHAATNPVVFSYGNSRNYGEWARIFVRYQPGRLDEALAYLKKEFNMLQPGIPMEYGFLDQDFEIQFHTEKLLRQLSIFFTTIAISIACLGLFGLTLFNAQRREKEIGVRKVLGASVTQVTYMLGCDFLKPLMFSFMIALPLAYYLMEKFLEGYVFRMTISYITFLLVVFSMVAIVLFTVSYQSIKAALKNPTDALKME